jgi:hypothetical protein
VLFAEIGNSTALILAASSLDFINGGEENPKHISNTIFLLEREEMQFPTHACAPALAAMIVDSIRVLRGRQRLFPGKYLISIGVAGALPDLLNPHISLAARLSSWTHTLWFILAIYPAYAILSGMWYRRRWILLTHWLWLATIAHLAVDTISNGTRPLYPYGPVIGCRLIRAGRPWILSDLILVPTTILLALWLQRQDRKTASAIQSDTSASNG